VLPHLDHGLTHGIIAVGQHHTLLKRKKVEQVVNGYHDLWPAGRTWWYEVGLFLIGDVENVGWAEMILAVSLDPLGLFAPAMANFTEG
jgi:hypothetical protein